MLASGGIRTVAVGSAANGDIAIGDHPHETVAFGDRQHAGIDPLHKFGRVAQRRVGVDHLYVTAHDVTNLHCLSSFPDPTRR
jgi:hypothetical protein